MIEDDSFADDVRFHGHTAYLTDVGRRVPKDDTPTSGGTAIDGDGNIYLLHVAERSRLWRLTPDARCSTVTADSRLHRGDVQWIDEGGDP